MQPALELFPQPPTKPRVQPGPNQRDLGQFFTPAWAAEVLFDAHFSHLGANDVVWEPTCGRGNMLAAVPAHIPAFGTEIDEILAHQARKNTGREVLVGDCRTVKIPGKVTAVFGNPPFTLDLFSELLELCAGLLENGQKAGFVLPAYFMQTSRTVLPWTKTWTIEQEIIPRDIFPNGLSKPLIFGLFTRDHSPRLVGFRLFPEIAAMREVTEEAQEALTNGIAGPRSVWRETVASAIRDLGGTADLSSIYRTIEGKRPTGNTHWKEQIRKVVQNTTHFLRVSDGTYALAAA